MPYGPALLAPFLKVQMPRVGVTLHVASGEMSQKRGMAGAFSALTLQGVCALLSKAHRCLDTFTSCSLHNVVNFI